jgi:hypothetical protein
MIRMIEVVNNSALISAPDIAAWIPIINAHLAADFAPAWGVSGTIYYGEAPSGAWRFTLQDGLDQLVMPLLA